MKRVDHAVPAAAVATDIRSDRLDVRHPVPPVLATLHLDPNVPTRTAPLPAPYLTPKEVFASPQQRDRDFFVPVGHPEAGNYEYAGLPFRMAEPPPKLDRAPLLGEHNREVLQALGYTDENIVRLARAGVV